MKRIIILLMLWIPVLNFILLLYLCTIIKKEYKNEILKVEIQNVREESQICKTKYPLLMIHGIGFRDLKFFNYWGRIPKSLKQNGAVIYYGNHHAWGTIENNAEEIKNKIVSMLNKNKYQKVNIIAHSKGGLDARYLISTLKMDNHVASLTTISTPHKGSELINFLNDKLKEKNYKKIASLINAYAKILGDKSPDCYNSSQQLHPEYIKIFNKNTPDSPKVYYQSYMGIIKKINKDKLLSIPYIIMKWMKGENDGLISLESSKWGNFKGCLSDQSKRGLSHGDVIDLKRKDYDNFNILEKYIKIVSELKNLGF
jgi:triacylglycerol lipase